MEKLIGLFLQTFLTFKIQQMKTDVQIQKDVMDELMWEPYLESAQIGVAVKNGVVTLSGQVDTYPKKNLAEKAAKRVSGVKAVAEDIQVGVSPSFRRTDTEIAAAAVDALKWHTAVQEEKIKVKVENAVITLDGEVEWDYQRTNAHNAVKNLIGVRYVNNFITVKPSLQPGDIKTKISAAFQRSATVDSSRIAVDVFGSRVVLHGTVRSFAEKEDAERAAWAAPGVTKVDNQISISLSEKVLV